MKITCGLTLMALVLLTAACEEVSTFPPLEIEPSEAAVETAMDLDDTLSQKVVNAGLVDVSSDSLTTIPSDSTRRDSRRPGDHRPDRSRAELAVALSG